MKHKIMMISAALALVAAGCTKPEDNNSKGNKGKDDKPKTDYVREIEPTPEGYYEFEGMTYREPGAEETYTPSVYARQYRPIDVKYYGGSAPEGTTPGTWEPKWTQGKCRTVRYMNGYEPAFKTFDKYAKWVNKYGSTKTMPKSEATGRFRTEKIDGRWWIIDPQGYRHYERSLTSMRYGSSTRNKNAWNAKYGTDAKWISDVRAEMFEYGFHGTGAFCTDTYTKILDHDAANPSAPLTIAPSFGFLSQFKSAKKLNSAGVNAAPLAAVLEDGWAEWCVQYMTGSAFAPYRGNINVLGFFSDNEINFSTNAASGRLLKVFLGLTDKNDRAKQFADNFMAEKKATAYTEALNDEFCALLAEKYYKAIKEARDIADPQMMYLGTRLHGYPKYMEGVVRACGAYCDIVSINYYSRWSPELDSYVQKWNTWARKPFLVTEFYVKGILDSDLENASGAGMAVPRQEDRAYWYQHFTLGLLEAPNCVGWHWFKYQDDDTGSANSPANKGMYDNEYNIFPNLAKFAREINYNVYDLIDWFDGRVK